MECVEIQVTCGSQVEGHRLAEALIERRQAACVQQVPIRSVYRWEGRVELDHETLLLIMTTEARIEDVQATIDEVHSYDLPAVTVVPITGGSQPYLDWIRKESTPG